VSADRDRTPSPRADVCVIGAGPAGALIAERLADRGHEVVVLEAGREFDFDSRLDRMERSIRPAHDGLSVWEMGGERDAYSSTGEWFYPLNTARVKGVGGSTLHWQGMVMRLHESDFETDSRFGVGDDWPIEYADLKPYYAEGEKALGVAGASDNPFAPPRDEPHPMPAFEPSYSDSLFAEACEESRRHDALGAERSQLRILRRRFAVCRLRHLQAGLSLGREVRRHPHHRRRPRGRRACDRPGTGPAPPPRRRWRDGHRRRVRHT
jgi:Choline dehydrogenase and related flavoproteins